MDNNQDMKVPYEVRPEGTSGTLNEIALQHRQSIHFYKEAARQLTGKEDGAAQFFTELAGYREKLLTAINERLADMPGGVHTPSHEGESWLKSHENDFTQAVNAANVAQVTQMAYSNENALSDTYRHALANDKLIDFAEQLLHEQHEEVLLWVHRADRYNTVPKSDGIE